MTEDEEMLYREMNEEDEFYMGDRQEDAPTDYNSPRDFSQVPVDRPANGSDAAVYGCLAVAIAAVLFVLAYLLL